MATLSRSKIAPFSREEWAALKRCERAIHSWAEELCNGTIRRDNDGSTRRYWPDRYGSPTIAGSVVPDKAEAAMERARKIAAAHGLSVYGQSDPRGCALHVFNAADLDGRPIDCCYSMVGRPVV